MRWRPTSIYYQVRDEQLQVVMAGRSQDGKRVKVTVLGTKPSFYVPAGEGKKNDAVTEVEPSCIRSLGGPWGESILLDRCFVKYPSDVPRLRESYSRHLETDVIYERRVRFDYQIKECIETPDGKSVIQAEDIKPSPGSSIEPRVCVLDIETMDSTDSNNPQAPVVSISLWDSKTDTYSILYAGIVKRPEEVQAWLTENGLKGKLHVLRDEKEMFAAFTQYVEKAGPDILTGWNAIGFDFEYLKNRANLKGYPAPNWREHELFDCMESYSFIVKQRSGNWVGLDEAAKEAGFEGKTTKKKIRKMIEDDEVERLLVYNCNDVRQNVKLVQKYKLVSFFVRLAGLAGCSLGDIFNKTEISLGRLAEAYTFHSARGVWALPSNRPKEDKQWYKVDGGVALTPVFGSHSPVIEVDNAQEYPATVRTLNISPETKVVDDYDGPCFQVPSGRRYRKEPRGFLPTMIDNLTWLRNESKKAGDADQDNVIKQLMNTLAYGTQASPYYRLGDPDIGNDITDIPRHHLHWNRDFIVNYQKTETAENKAIGGFTDAVYYVPMEGHDPVGMLKELNKSLDQFAAQFGADKHHFAVKLEHTYIGGVIRAEEGNTRGCYAFVYENQKSGEFERNGKRYSMKIRGFEERRGDAAPLTKRLQKEVLFRAAMGEDVIGYLQGIATDLLAGKIDSREVRLPKRIQQADYTKAIPQHVRAARYSNQHLGTSYGTGDKVCVIFGYLVGCPRTDVFALDWNDPLPANAEVDWQKTLDRVVISPLEAVLGMLGISKQSITASTAPAEDYF